MGATYDRHPEGASVHSVYDARRALAAFRGGAPESVRSDAAPLELASGLGGAPPRLQPAQSIEGPALTAWVVQGSPAAAFTAFLDGIQRSHVVDYEQWTVPVVHGTVAAAIRERRDRRMSTWNGSTTIEQSIYLPLAAAGEPLSAWFRGRGFDVVDTTPADLTELGAGHPHALLVWASQAVRRRREQAEGRLAARWAAEMHEPLYVDGGIGAFAAAARSEQVVGVIKSHRTLYVAADAIGTVAGLAEGERTTAFAVDWTGRTRVASWYLRLRAAVPGDPFAGIVRVEVAEAGFSTARADDVSAMVLAEREPVALPDSRWRVMAYGIRDCEEYLRAVAGAR